MDLKLVREWNAMFQQGGANLNFQRAEEILKIEEAAGRDTEDQRELLESYR